MRIIIVSLVLFLSACNDSGTTEVVKKVPYSDPALVAKVDALTKALAAATAVEAQQALSISKLQIIGKAHGIATAERTLAIGQAAAASPDFGPCTDMGVLVGRGVNVVNPLAATIESFQTCTGYSYTVSVLDGKIQPPFYVAWLEPNCQGDPVIETDIPGNGFNPQMYATGVVFSNPIDGTVHYIPANSSPVSVQIQSAMNNGPGGGSCGVDVETRMVIVAPSNDPSVTGVPSEQISGTITLSSP